MKLRGASTKAGSGALLASHYATLKEEFRPQAARAVRPAETIAVADDDLLEIEFDDGVRNWLRADDYRERFGGCPSRDASGTAVVSMRTPSPRAGPGTGSPGMKRGPTVVGKVSS